MNLYAAIMLLISLPVSYTTFHQLPFELPQLLIAANIGTLAVMIPFVLAFDLPEPAAPDPGWVRYAGSCRGVRSPRSLPTLPGEWGTVTFFRAMRCAVRSR